MSVELFSLYLQIAGLVGVVAFSIAAKRRSAKVVFGAVLMFGVNIVGQVVIAGTPGACVGFFSLPIVGVMAALATDWLVSARRERMKKMADENEDAVRHERKCVRSRINLRNWAFWLTWAGLALSLAGFWLIGVVRGGGIPIVLWSWLLGFLAACAGFVLALRARTGRQFALVSLVFTGLVFLSGLLSPVITHLMYAPLRVEGCRWNLGVLGERLVAHSRTNEGGMIVGDGWCDVLSQEKTARDALRCRASLAERGQCSYALNEAVVGKAIDSMPPDTVLLFESAPGWNACGGAELLSFDNHRLYFRPRANVMLVDGTIVTVTKKTSDDLRWR